MAGKSVKTHPIWENRGLAIDAYSNLEHALCALMAKLLGTSVQKTSIVFFKITSARARNNILEKLIKEDYGSLYNIFWNSFLKELGNVDLARNEIVHYASLVETDDGIETATLVPNLYAFSAGTSPEIDVKMLREFRKKCNLMSNIITYFQIFIISESTMVRHGVGDMTSAFQQIFRERFLYPLPSSHPIFQSGPKPRNPPQSSQA